MTIWEMLAEAVQSLHEPFGRQDVLRWFATHHPETNPNSVSTHLHMATSDTSAENRGAFARRTPLVTHVGRGEYIRYRSDGRQLPPRDAPIRETHTPTDPTPLAASSEEAFDIALVSCGTAKRSTPSAAADLYTSDGFRKRRAIAEDAGRVWSSCLPSTVWYRRTKSSRRTTWRSRRPARTTAPPGEPGSSRS